MANISVTDRKFHFGPPSVGPGVSSQKACLDGRRVTKAGAEAQTRAKRLSKGTEAREASPIHSGGRSRAAFIGIMVRSPFNSANRRCHGVRIRASLRGRNGLARASSTMGTPCPLPVGSKSPGPT